MASKTESKKKLTTGLLKRGQTTEEPEASSESDELSESDQSSESEESTTSDESTESDQSSESEESSDSDESSESEESDYMTKKVSATKPTNLYRKPLSAVTYQPPYTDMARARSAACSLGQGRKPRRVCKPDWYGTKGQNQPVYGKGVCFIIANFTEDLQGYLEDIDRIAELHKTTLKTEHVYTKYFGEHPMNNLSERQFRSLLKKIQNYLQTPPMCDIDRFFMYILSHGDENGIYMCQEGSRIEAETREVTENDRGEDRIGHKVFEENAEALDERPKVRKMVVTIPLSDIVEFFTHNNLKSLKGYPKVFFNQSCRGEKILQAAHSKPPSGDRQSKTTRKVAIGADVLVCDSASYLYRSYVGDQSGSLFIKSLLEELKINYKTEHLADILVKVNKTISEERNPFRDNEGYLLEAYQMPEIHSKLTKKFFLAIPGNMPRNY